MWIRGRLWELFEFVDGNFTALELAAQYSRLSKIHKGNPEEEQILQDAFSILNAPLTRQFYHGCHMVMRHIKDDIGDSSFEQAESEIWDGIWGWVSQRWQPPPDELVNALVIKYRRKEKPEVKTKDGQERYQKAAPGNVRPSKSRNYPAAKRKSIAILLAIFFAFWTWLYTYKKDSRKFWINLGVSIVTFGLWVIVAWIWAIIDTALKPAEFYRKYPDANPVSPKRAAP